MGDVVWNPAALERLFRGPSGPVARDLARRAVRVETAAKVLASGAFPPASIPGAPPHLRTGHLRASITWRLGEDTRGLYAAIGSNLDYAAYLERGTDRMAARPFLKPALQAARG